MARPLMKAVDSGLDVLFSSDNDMIVGVDSAIEMRDRWPRFQYAVLTVNHFRYYYTEEGRRVLSRWLAEPG